MVKISMKPANPMLRFAGLGNWWRRWDSNPHSLAGSGFKDRCVYRFTTPPKALTKARICPAPQLGSDTGLLVMASVVGEQGTPKLLLFSWRFSLLMEPMPSPRTGARA